MVFEELHRICVTGLFELLDFSEENRTNSGITKQQIRDMNLDFLMNSHHGNSNKAGINLACALLRFHWQCIPNDISTSEHNLQVLE